MRRSEIIDRIKEIIINGRILTNGNSIMEDTSLINECGLDSVGVIDLVVCIEEKFGFEFDDTDLELFNFESIATIADLVLKKVD